MSQNVGTLNNGNASVVIEEARPGPPPPIGPDEPAAHVVRLALMVGEQRLREKDAEVQRGDPEGVHQMRTAARRLRSELRLFGGLLEGDWGERLGGELKWMGKLLGAVRDLDVMRARLHDSGADLIEDLGPLFTALGHRHTAATAELHAARQGERFETLMRELVDAAANPLFRDDAWEPCRRALPPLVLGVWNRLRSAGRALDLTSADEQYHEVRKRAKRARYAAEAVAEALDPSDANAALRFARRARSVQDVLGEHQDATVACRAIRRVAAENLSDGPFNLAAGRLLERQQVAADRSRTRFFKVWQKLDRKKSRDWMKA
jgi:CHAD domain-containing protein